jgi:hypothetical protein
VALDDPEEIRELFSAFGAVSVRRMFSGAGLFAEGVMFALRIRDDIFLKADKAPGRRQLAVALARPLARRSGGAGEFRARGGEEIAAYPAKASKNQTLIEKVQATCCSGFPIAVSSTTRLRPACFAA